MMTRVYASSVIGASIDEVWERIRDFNGLPNWHPRMRESRIENTLPADKVGCIRIFKLQNGDTIREQLLGLSDYDKVCTYSILDSPMPITDHVATLSLTPVTHGDRCFVQWSAEFRCSADDEDGLIKRMSTDVFQVGFDALKRHFGG